MECPLGPTCRWVLTPPTSVLTWVAPLYEEPQSESMDGAEDLVFQGESVLGHLKSILNIRTFWAGLGEPRSWPGDAG